MTRVLDRLRLMRTPISLPWFNRLGLVLLKVAVLGVVLGVANRVALRRI